MQDYALVYVSRCTPHLSEIDIIRILHQASVHNAKRGLTSILAHKTGQFFQLIEGNVDQVAALFDKIRRDHRHSLVEQIFFEPRVAHIAKTPMLYRHRSSDIPKAYRDFFHRAFDFASLRGQPALMHEFFVRLAVPVASGQDIQYQTYKEKLLADIRKDTDKTRETIEYRGVRPFY